MVVARAASDVIVAAITMDAVVATVAMDVVVATVADTSTEIDERGRETIFTDALGNQTTYDYGPFTAEIYRDLDSLTGRGRIVGLGAQDRPQSNERSYRATAQGRAYLARLHFHPAQEKNLLAVRSEVSSLNFRDLLRRVYLAHPESAERSIARGILD